MGVAPDGRERRNLSGKNDLINVRAELDLRPKKRLEIRRRGLAQMPDLKSARRQSAARHLAANTHQRHQPELYVLPIQPAIGVDILERNRRTFAKTATQANPFIDNSAVALRITQGIGKVRGRGYHVVNQADLAEVEVARQAKAKELLVKFLGCKFQEFDLGSRLQTSGWIIDRLGGQARPRQEWGDILAFLAKRCACKARDPAGCARYGAEAFRSAIAHEPIVPSGPPAA